ncbi:MAG TPA: MFS transporter [Planctomycetaceae bacterium]|nr:MFS transporter [Planctomycetaceae bacterium]
MSESQTARPGGSFRSLPWNVKLLGLASLLNDIASEMVFPLLPDFITRVLRGNALDIGIIEGAADTTASLLKLWTGGLSDRLGSRRWFVISGYVLAALTRPLMGLARNPWDLLAVRMADRTGKGIRTAPRDALIADSTPAEQRGRAFGFHRAMDHVGAAVGPLLAAAFLWFVPSGYRLLFFLTAIPGLAVAFLLAWGLRDQERPRPAADRPKFHLSLAPFDWRFRLYLVSLALFTLGNSSDAFLLLRSQQLGVPTYALPILWSLFHVLKSTGNLIAGPVVDRVGTRPLIVAGWGVYAGIYVLFGLATEAWQAWLLFLGYSLFYALTEPAEKTLVANLVSGEHKGLAYGWFNFAIGITSLPSSVIFGALYSQFGPLTAFAWGAGLAFIASALLAFVRR